MVLLIDFCCSKIASLNALLAPELNKINSIK